MQTGLLLCNFVPCVEDWLSEGLSGRSERTRTICRDGVKPLTDQIGSKQFRKLTARDVRSALAALSDRLSTRSLQIAHNCLVRAIRHAEAGDVVARNVAALVRPPTGRQGRQSKALTVEQAQALIRAAADHRHARDGGEATARPYRLHAYIVLPLTTGIRPKKRVRSAGTTSTCKQAPSPSGVPTGQEAMPRRRCRGAP